MQTEHSTAAGISLPARIGNMPSGMVSAGISALITVHRAAVLRDEANFDDEGNALDVAAAEASASVELEAFRAFAAAPCQTHGDVQAKVSYLLAGSVGMRDTLIDCLIDYGDDLLPSLLASLAVTSEA